MRKLLLPSNIIKNRETEMLKIEEIPGLVFLDLLYDKQCFQSRDLDPLAVGNVSKFFPAS